MNINYIDVNKMGKILKSYNLNQDNIISFMATTSEDEFKHLFGIYLVATLEDYKHINHLVNHVYGINDDNKPSIEIIDKALDKNFWKMVLQEEYKDTNICFSYDMKNYHLSIEYINYKLLNQIQSVEEQLKGEKYFLKKIVLCKKKIKVKLKYKLSYSNFKKKYNKDFNWANGKMMTFDELLEMYNKIVNEKISRNSELDLYDACSEAKNDIIAINEKSRLIKKLEADLEYNYIILNKLFDEEFLKLSSLDEILYAIRKIMVEHDFTYKPKTFYDEFIYWRNADKLDIKYRENDIAGVNYFYKKTSSLENLENDMNVLKKDLEQILKIENDEEYIKRTYLLTQRFLQIHPYSNGNGRTSKYLFYYLLLKRNILPPTITDDNYLSDSYLKYGGTGEYIEERINIMNDRIKLK